MHALKQSLIILTGALTFASQVEAQTLADSLENVRDSLKNSTVLDIDIPQYNYFGEGNNTRAVGWYDGLDTKTSNYESDRLPEKEQYLLTEKLRTILQLVIQNKELEYDVDTISIVKDISNMLEAYQSYCNQNGINVTNGDKLFDYIVGSKTLLSLGEDWELIRNNVKDEEEEKDDMTIELIVKKNSIVPVTIEEDNDSNLNCYLYEETIFVSETQAIKICDNLSIKYTKDAGKGWEALPYQNFTPYNPDNNISHLYNPNLDNIEPEKSKNMFIHIVTPNNIIVAYTLDGGENWQCYKRRRNRKHKRVLDALNNQVIWFTSESKQNDGSHIQGMRHWIKKRFNKGLSKLEYYVLPNQESNI